MLLGEGCGRLVEIQCAELEEDQHQPDDEPEVAHAVGDKGLDSRGRCVGPVEVEPDQQITAQAHQLPADKQKQQTAADYQPQHAETEQRQVGEEAAVFALPVHLIAVTGHVPDAEEEDQKRDYGDHEEHGHCQ